MRKLFETVAAGLMVGVVLASAVFLFGMRASTPAVTGRVRRFNRAVGNPRMMRRAGGPGVTTAVIRHVGRTSGADYETPVGAVATEDGFVIALPYGRDADWMKNVLADGRAALLHDGATHELVAPELVPTHRVIGYFGPGDRAAFRVFAVEECLRLHTRPGG